MQLSLLLLLPLLSLDESANDIWMANAGVMRATMIMIGSVIVILTSPLQINDVILMLAMRAMLLLLLLLLFGRVGGGVVRQPVRW